LSFDGSNLGIGVPSPAATLDVYGGASGRLQIYSSASGNFLTSKVAANTGYQILNYLGSQHVWGDGTSTLMTLNASGNVGVGTDNPSTKLHVNSGAVDEVARFEGTGSPYISIYDTNVRQFYIFTSSVGVDLVVEPAKPLRFATNGITRASIDVAGVFNSGTIQTSGTPVGTFSASKWFIQTEDTVTTRAYFTGPNSSTYGSWEIYNATSTGTPRLAAAFTADYTRFGKPGSTDEALRITNAGNVGIGQTNPTSRLEILGTTTNYGITSVNPSGYGAFNLRSTTIPAQVWSFIANDNGANSDLLIYGGAGAGVKVALDSAGNFGVGTNSPVSYLGGTAKVVVVANTNSQHSLLVRNDSAGSSASSAIVINGYGNQWGIEVGSAAKNNNALTFQLDYAGTNAEKMRLTTSGQLIIGTTSAISGLTSGAIQVGAGPYAGLTTTGSGDTTRIITEGAIEFNYDGVSGTQRHGKIRGTGNTAAGAYAGGLAFEYYGFNGSAYQWYTGLELTSIGNVGIGTDNPTVKLEVNGQIKSSGININQNNNLLFFSKTGGGDGTSSNNTHFIGRVDTTGFHVVADGAGGFNSIADSFVVGAKGSLILATTTPTTTYSSGRVIITQTGDVGVGTSSPAQKLHVSGTSASNSSINALVANGVYQVNLAVMGSSYNYAGAYVNEGWLYTDSSNLCIGPYGNHAVKFLAGGEERARITAAGNVGIRTTAPESAFHVKLSGSTFNIPTNNAIGGGTANRVHFMGTEPGLMLSSDMNVANAAATGTGTLSLGLQIGYYGANDVRSQLFWAGSNPLTFVYASTPTGTPQERMRIDSTGIVTVNGVALGRIQTDILRMWRTSDKEGRNSFYPDGGTVYYSWDNGVLRMDASIGSHNWDIGKILLPAGSYQLVIQYRPSPTQHDWTTFGTNSNGHSIRLQTNGGYGAFSTLGSVSAFAINKDLEYSTTYASGVITIGSDSVLRVGMGTDPYSGGGYKYYVEAAYIIRVR
jgi:hypothetical protein